MKNKSKSRVGIVFSRIFKFENWFDWERVKSFTLYIGNGIKRFVVPDPATETESFKAAMARMNLSEADLLLKQKALFRLSVLMVIAALLIFGYSVYNLFYGTFKASGISLIVVFIALVLAYRYHFWYYQIKRRKLGCTFNEWFRHGLMGEKE